MSVSSLEEAKAITHREISDFSRNAGIECVILDHATVSIDDGWIFFYNSRQYVETQDISHALAGNGPIFISKTGVIVNLPTHRPWHESLNEVRADLRLTNSGDA